MIGNIVKLWDIGQLPFHVGPQLRATNGELPDFLPFALGLDERVGLLMELPDARVQSALQCAYQSGSQIGTPMAQAGFGRRYADDFIAFIQEQFPGSAIKDKRVLEVGCGTGYVLKVLKELGASVCGIEPGGSKSSVYAEAAGIDVLYQNFSANLFSEQFDLIIHTFVAEHIEDPIDFFKEQLELLKPAGKIIFSVPDCTDPLIYGDLSILVHEHWSYFSQENLARLSAYLGMREDQCCKSNFGGSLYSVWSMSTESTGSGTASASANNVSNRINEDYQAANDFCTLARKSVDVIQQYLADVAQNNQTLGVYCPNRFINYHALTGNKPVIRFFDDDSNLSGKYFPPIDIAIESRQSLLANPVDHLLIMSRTFGVSLKQALLQNTALQPCQILTIADLF